LVVGRESLAKPKASATTKANHGSNLIKSD
jgi:hypothetical protein